jgi:hypothetical protein
MKTGFVDRALRGAELETWCELAANALAGFFESPRK